MIPNADIHLFHFKTCIITAYDSVGNGQAGQTHARGNKPEIGYCQARFACWVLGRLRHLRNPLAWRLCVSAGFSGQVIA